MIRVPAKQSSACGISLRTQIPVQSLPSFTCRACRPYKTRLLHTSIHSADHSPRRDIASADRNFKQIRSLHSLEEKIISANEAVPELGFTFNRNLRGNKDLSHITKVGDVNSQIRKSLRAWSLQNEHIKQQNLPADEYAESRVRDIPNALFRPKFEDEVVKEDLQEDLGEINDDEYDPADQILKPGSAIYHKHGAYAVYLGAIGQKAQLATQSGRWAMEVLRSFRRVNGHGRCVVENFLTSEEVSRLKACMPQEENISTSPNYELDRESIQGVMQGPGAQEATASIRQKLQAFAAEVDDFDRQYGRDVDAAYHKVAHESEWRILTLHEYTKEMGIDLVSLQDSARMAIVRRIDAAAHTSVTNKAAILLVVCYPKELNGQMLRVAAWARSYQDAAAQAALGKDVTATLRQNPLASFIDKSRRLILKSRKIRAMTATAGLHPLSNKIPFPRAEPTGEQFSDNDKLIIKFVVNTVYRTPKSESDGLWKVGPVTSLILRAVGAYPGVGLDHSTGRTFLKEIGCVNPWATEGLFDVTLPVPNTGSSYRADPIKEARQAETEAFMKLTEPELAKLDKMPQLRKNWASLTTFAIDSARTILPEDAVSIEPADEVSGGYWIHSHVSHITSFLDVESAIVQHARKQGRTFASPESRMLVDMIPHPIIQEFTIRSGGPCLTISTLITPDGRVHDCKIQPGVLGQVERLDKLAVDRILGIEPHFQSTSTLIVGKVTNNLIRKVTGAAIAQAQKHKDTLVLLKELLDARHAFRRSESPTHIKQIDREFSFQAISSLIGHPQTMLSDYESNHWTGEPGIVLSARHQVLFRTPDEKREEDFIAQLSHLCYESAGTWCVDRNLPVVFMGQQPHPGSKLEAAREDSSLQGVKPYIVRSASPVPNINLNIKAFVTCTSPIRRFFDMYNHFQIDSYLLAEANGLIAPGGRVTDENILAFTYAQVDEYVQGDAGGSDHVSWIAQKAKKAISFQALSRAFNFKEAALPDIWEVYIRQPSRVSSTGRASVAYGFLLPFVVPCEIESGPEKWDQTAKRGNFIRVKIASIDGDRMDMKVTPVSAPTQEQTMLEPLNIQTEDNIFNDEERVEYEKARQAADQNAQNDGFRFMSGSNIGSESSGDDCST